MKQWSITEFEKLLNANGFVYDHRKGSHLVFYNANNIHISVPRNLKSVIALRLIKQYNLKE